MPCTALLRLLMWSTMRRQVKHYPTNYQASNVLTVAATSITKNGVFWNTKNPEYMPAWSDYGMCVRLACKAPRSLFMQRHKCAGGFV